MNKIKVIELLNMISKYEEVPKKIEFEGEIYEFSKNIHGYWGGKNKDCFKAMVNWRYLNNEVEILDKIEEKKIPGKLEQIVSKQGKYNSIDELAEEIFKAFKTIDNLIINQNQLIDYLESKEKGE